MRRATSNILYLFADCLHRSSHSSLRPPLGSRKAVINALFIPSRHGALDGEALGQLGTVRLCSNPFYNAQQSLLHPFRADTSITTFRHIGIPFFPPLAYTFPSTAHRDTHIAVAS